ncbi:MarR family transcriptional regulator [Anaerotignum lactatifermentans]|uniref:MarR family transcriptional regulator n=1 Tax=Anaerotignum lactatifermentans TaxID=160404 RepID=A0ABS2GBI5_9FIRM|nr:bilirubin utilization transcriptional regulator BilQ [Anaerotignum lactatifermentans]MBM6829571.1 MarR family transcriptional regulator [Anaerotignum lactatifermentans]MBM6878065.1 MarR family transcriptional regulator [Anaerotignum lactatifermentans]MBM6951105.1 MarR family transcriptional regulator [Anaerotignum lactatifermentans]
MKDTLAFLVSQLRRDFSAYCGHQLQEMGVTQRELFYIIYIGNHGGCLAKEVSAALAADAGYTARLLAKLEERGFLRQEVNPQDKRAKQLYLTEEGEKISQASRRLFAQWDEEVFSRFSQEERQALLSQMKKIWAQRRAEADV